MDNKVYVFEGKTSTEAIEKGLKELKVSKNKVEIKVLESGLSKYISSALAKSASLKLSNSSLYLSP